MATSSRQVHRSRAGRLGASVWFVVAGLNLADIAVRGSGQSGRVAFSVVVAISVAVYLVWFRPAVVVDDQRVVLLNVLRDAVVPWRAVTAVDATDTLRVHAGERVFRSWAIQAPNRTRARSRRRSSVRSSGRGDVPEDVWNAFAGRTPADFVADEIRQRWERQRNAPGEVSASEPHTRWNVAGVAVLTLAVLAVLATSLAG